ncbi:MAG TPA: sulfotransferase [Gaiellaceae bacterium]|nr:sulfotransferase [Gaiellaceae bacterium]
MRSRIRRLLRGIRVEPRRSEPEPVGEAEWERLALRFADDGPGVVGATGGSGTRVVARVLRRAGMFLGDDLNRSEDALDFAAFSDRWINRYAAGESPPEMSRELRGLVARQHADADGRRWGWKEPRSVYLLELLDRQLPGLRFLHVVRDGRDMAYSENQVQLRKHGDAVLGHAREGETDALRSIALWSEVNLRAADYGERALGDRYLRVRFEDLCADPSGTVAGILGFFRLSVDVEGIAAEEVHPPETLGRWRNATPETTRALEERAGDALRRFGYQSSSE